MKAFVLPAFGETASLTDMDTPTPAADEVRVRVHAASVNGFDLAVAAEMMRDVVEHRFPVVLGKDFAGIIDAVGTAVDGYAVGDKVFGVLTKPFIGDGSFAEYATVNPVAGLARIPEGVSFTDAAALGLAGTAAVDSVAAAAISETDTVFIAGATGGVGIQAVQLAALAGARVIATAHTAQEVRAVRALGASETVDHKGDIATQVLELAPGGVDVVLHLAGDPLALKDVVAPGSRFVSPLLHSPNQLAFDAVRVVPVHALPSSDTLNLLATRHSTGRTQLVIERAYPLDEADAAFAAFARGTLGKIVVTITP